MNAEGLRRRRREAALYREEHGATLEEAGRAFDMTAATVMRGARELAAERAGVEPRGKRTESELADMHARGLNPVTVYAAGCRCETCRAAKAREWERRRDAMNRRAEEAAAAERINALTAKAAEPIRELYIHGLGTLTVTPTGERIVKAVE